jgi:ATP-binding cassette subfamily B protein RaxB
MTVLFAKRGAVPMQFQAQTSECGLACLAMISSYFGKELSLSQLRERYRITSLGASIKDLMEAANSLSLGCRPLKLELGDLDKLQLPVILHWDLDHFVVLTKVSRQSFTIHDPAVGVRNYSLAELNLHFTGVALEISCLQDFAPEKSSAALSLRQLFKPGSDFFRTALQVFLLSILIQILAISAPLYLQLVIDQGISLQDKDLIVLLAFLFLIITIAKSVVSYFRGVVLLQFSSQVGFQLARNTFGHLIRLPISFFENREIGDIVSRFGSLETIKQLVTQEMITVIVDGIFSFVTLVLLFLYSPILGGLALASISLFCLVRILALKKERTLRQEALVAAARQQTGFIENVRTIVTTKLYGLETERGNSWLADYTRLINSGYFLGKFQLSVGTAQSLLFGLDSIATIYLGTDLVLNQGMTIGQLISFIFLKQNFVGSVSAMIPKLAEIQLMKLELDRLSDITLSLADVVEESTSLIEAKSAGQIELADVCFRYADNSSWVIEGLNLTLSAGQSLGIYGQSGCGKTTLIKLLLGLEKPSKGAITIDGKEQNKDSWQLMRGKMAAVTHGETVLTGSIAYNIHLGLDDFNQAKLQSVCQITGLDELISNLPMGFSTPLTEAGVVLSAGQLQRLLLARALYQQPKILVLDEALSHLGDAAAIEILKRLRTLGISLILVSHNPRLIELLDHQLQLGGKP